MKKLIRMNEYAHQPNGLFLFAELYSYSNNRNKTSFWPDNSQAGKIIFPRSVLT